MGGRIGTAPRAAEQLGGDEGAGAGSETDARALVAARVEDAGDPGSGPTTGRWSGQYGLNPR
ncbi:hypothetical protein GA0115255_112243 [Streptomyces sp. Ncost-T6T-2b]|nr:hypothetical protein GA0115255_112243 [Streptomyces sp. Ncost-T6T-2b]